MDLPSSSSFTPLATLHLPSPHVLHPQACNPTMDLVALLSIPAGQDGRGKAAAASTSKITLWRMTGTKVWEADVAGIVGGLAWTIDGLYLSVLVMEGQFQTTLEHLSVHTGETTKRISDSVSSSNARSVTILDGTAWWELKWMSSGEEWPTASSGSAAKLVDSLPRATPVEPPQAAHAHPFMLPNAAKAKKPSGSTPHDHLWAFPSLLPACVPTLPDILHVARPGDAATRRYLTGTLRLGRDISVNKATLRFAQTNDRICGLLNIVLRGLESIDHAFKEGEKQTMIWREELETIADQQGISRPDMFADLFNLLVAGRAGPNIAEWLGQRLTGRTAAKWETTLETSFKTIRKIMGESVIPALERIALLLEELRGWSKVSTFAHLQLDEQKMHHLLDLTVGFARLAENMRQQAEVEMHASAEWFKWLKYEMARSASHDITNEHIVPPPYDTKLAWHFLKRGFVQSPLLVHLPQQFRAKPTTDHLPSGFEPNPRPSIRPLDQVLEATERSLTRSTSAQDGMRDELSPVNQDTSIDSSMAMTPPADVSVLPSSPEIPSSPDTVGEGHKDELLDEFKEPPRTLDLEPWVWANTLLAGLQMALEMPGLESARVEPWSRPPGVRVAKRTVDDAEWLAISDASAGTVSVSRSTPDECDITVFTLSGSSVLAMEFFDDLELALLLQSSAGERHLVTVEYANAQLAPCGPITGPAEHLTAAASAPMTSLPIGRSRYLKTVSHAEDNERVSIALNGRKGRRVGCVIMGDGREVEVLDMDEDEGDEDEEDEGDMSGVIEA